MYENKTAENIKANILAGVQNVDKQEGSFLNDMVTPIGIEMSEIYSQCDKIISMMFINGLAGIYLEAKANEYGLTRKSSTVDGVTVYETDEELRIRLIRQIKSPAASGNKADYIKWCTSIVDIADAKVIPIWNGNGTVKILPVTTSRRAPSSEKIAEISTFIESNRPIGATVTIEAPTEVSINVTATVVLKDSSKLLQATQKYTDLITKYLQDSVFKLSTVDYYKCLSFLYDLEEVQSVSIFKINNGTANITIDNTSIQVIGTVSITEAV